MKQLITEVKWSTVDIFTSQERFGGINAMQSGKKKTTDVCFNSCCKPGEEIIIIFTYITYVCLRKLLYIKSSRPTLSGRPAEDASSMIQIDYILAFQLIKTE